MRVLVLTLFADQLLDQVLWRAVLAALATHHGAFEAEAQADHDAVAESSLQGLLELREVEFGEESEGAEREGEDGGHDALEEPACVEDCAVAAELGFGEWVNPEIRR